MFTLFYALCTFDPSTHVHACNTKQLSGITTMADCRASADIMTGLLYKFPHATKVDAFCNETQMTGPKLRSLG